MDRRTLLKCVAAVSVAGCSVHEGAARGLRVVVVGAGIVGASIAWHLAKAGATVTVIDRAGPATHASRGTFAWINATWAKQPRHYHRLSQDGVSSWRSLQEELSLPVRWGGSLEWFDSSERQLQLAERIAEQAAWGEPARIVDRAELETLESSVDFGAVTAAALSGNDGAVDPIVATERLLEAAVALGAELNRVIAPPGIHMHQRDDGRIVLGEQAGAPDTDAHAARLAGRPNDFPSRGIALEHAERMRAIASGYLPAIARAEFDHVYIGWRPLPLDGHPVIGAAPARPDVYLAVMHSGVTLAPIAGQLAAVELTGQGPVERLEAFRPGRTFEYIKRY